MKSDRPGSLGSIPTLTEVVTLPAPARPDGSGPAVEPSPEPTVRMKPEPATDVGVSAQPMVPAEEPVGSVKLAEPPAGRGDVPVQESAPALCPTAPEIAGSPAIEAARLAPSEEQLTLHILADLQRQVDAVLEYRVREILTPILNRATDAVVREAKSELAHSLRDLVARSVAEELRRQRLC